MDQAEAIELIKQRFGKKTSNKRWRHYVSPIIGGSMLLLFFVGLFTLAVVAPQAFYVEGQIRGNHLTSGLISLGLTGYIVAACFLLVWRRSSKDPYLG